MEIGIQSVPYCFWIPAFAGMDERAMAGGFKPSQIKQKLSDAFEEVFFKVFADDGRVIPHEVIPLAAEAVDEAENA